jgi:peptidoglycan hydrolase-like protein with peptidoglycan-binding domain
MRMIRKSFVVAAACGLLALGVAACGSSGGSSSAGTTTTTATAAGGTRPELLRDVPEPVITVAYLLQDELDGLGYDVGQIDDGYVARVVKALQKFQRAHGLPATGAFDEATAVALRTATGRQSPTIVRSIQSVLTELGEYQGAIDGSYGPATTAAVTAVQQQAGITKHPGQVDAATLAAMVDLWRKKQLPAPQEAPTAGPDLLKIGASGADVESVQRRLVELGYRPGGTDGNFGVEMLSAVTAFQKHEGLDRDGVVGADVRKHLEHPTGAGPHSTAPTPHVEVDLDRQIAFLVLPGGTTIIDVSTGSGKTYVTPGTTAPQVAYTPTGTFSVYRAVDAPVVAPLGTLYKPLYFKEGWAMHGEPVVPPYPASHGCVRTHDWDQDWLWPQIPVGTPITIYGHNPGDPGAPDVPANAGAGY